MSEEDGTTKTYTQAEVDAIAATARKREAERLTSKYADYDELKAKAAEADKGKSQLDKVQSQLEELTKRNAQLDRDAMVRRVADELGVSVAQARRLEGTTEEELLADGREFYKDWPGRKNTGGGNGKAEGEGEGGDGSGGSASDGDDGKANRGSAGGGRQRPNEEGMRPGAPVNNGGKEETNPMKLAELIPR